MPAVPYAIYVVIFWACIGLGVWALIDAAVRRTDAFAAVTNQTKVFWIAILAGGLLAQYIFPALGAGILGILGLAGIVAAIVYLVGVRPKIIEITKGPRY